MCARVCECASDVCQFYHCQLKKHVSGGRGEFSRNVVLARISVTQISCLREASFAPKGNNEDTERIPADEHACGCTFKFQRRAVYNNLPLVYAFMKESPVGFWGVLQKPLCLKTQWAEKSDRQKEKNGRLITDNHVMA